MAAGKLTVPLQEAVDTALEAAEEGTTPRRYIGASMVAQECERAVWYDWLWATDKKWRGQMLRRFETGHQYEPRIIDNMRLAGYEVHCENPKARNEKKQYAAEWLGGFFRGHVDGFIRGGDDAGILDLGDKWHLLEIKAMRSAKYAYADDDEEYNCPIANKHPIEHPTAYGNESNIEGRWWKVKRRGVKKDIPTYYGQMQSYMGISRERHSSGKPFWLYWGLDGPLDRGLFVAVNTDTEQIHAELVEYEPKWWAAAKARALRVVRNRDGGPERKLESPLYPPCKWCDHRPVCHEGQPMEKSCRSCKHAQVRVPGDEGFYGSRSQWLCGKHGHGCGNFAACDDYDSMVEEITF